MILNNYKAVINNQYQTVVTNMQADRNNGYRPELFYYSVRLSHNYEGMKSIICADSDISYEEFLILSAEMRSLEIAIEDMETV